MAKLSVYNTIDRSQLGGKFVPLIQSGVSNYKILASDLGKEYHPGDAIEITDTGEINVNYDQNTLELSGSELSVKTDAARGVFGGSNGIYIASADSSIGISNAGIYIQVADHSIGVGSHGIYLKTADNSISVHTNGIKVDPSALVGKGLSGDGGTLYVVSANDSILVSEHGIKVNPWDGLSADSHGLYVEVADTTISVNSDGVKVRTGYGLIASDYGLSVRSADNSIDTSYAGIKVNPSAITGTGLVTTNGAIGVNVNTATGIIVKDNKLYLNSGDGLQTSNNAVSVKAADKSINVLSSGIKVNTGYGLSATADGLYVQPSDSSIYVSSGGVRVRVREGGGILSGDDGLYFDSGAIELPSAGSLSGAGLGHTYSNLYVMSADNSIAVSEHGIKVNTGYGLSATSDGLYVKSADNSIDVSSNGIKVNYGSGLLVGSNGLSVNYSHVCKELSGGNIRNASGDYFYASATVMAGEGLRARGDYDAVLNVYRGSGIGLTEYGAITVDIPYVSRNVVSQICGQGLKVVDSSSLYVKSADKSIDVSTGGIKVHVQSGGGILSGEQGLYLDSHSLPSANSLAGPGLGHTYSNLYVMAADNSIGVSAAGIKVNSSALVGASLYVDSANNTLNVDSSLLAGKGLKSDGSYLNVHIGSFASAGLGYSESSLYVLSADNSIGVTNAGIKVNTLNIAGDGLGGANNTLYVNSAWLAGHGLMSNASGKLEIYCGSGLALDTSSGKVYVTSAVNPDFGKGLWLASDNNSLLSVYAGSGLTFDDQNRVSVYVGSGLEFDSTNPHSRIRVKAANSTISVGVSGISVNTGPGLAYLSGKLGVGVRDNSIGISSSGIYVNSANNSLSTIDAGIKVNTMGLAGVGLGGAVDSFYVMSADNTISVTSEGIKVTEGFGTPDYSSVVTLSKTVNKVQQAPADGTLMVTYNGSNQDSSFGKYQVNICNADGTTITIGVLAGRAGYEGSCFGASCPISKGTYFKVTLWSGIAGDANFIFVPNIKG